MPYKERLKQLNLPTLNYRRVRGDMILVYKVLHGLIDGACACHLPLSNLVHTRGNSYKLHQNLIKHSFTSHFFSNRVVKLWNSLPNNVVTASSVHSFEHRLDTHWLNQDLVFNWHAVIAGTGDRSHLNC